MKKPAWAIGMRLKAVVDGEMVSLGDTGELNGYSRAINADTLEEEWTVLVYVAGVGVVETAPEFWEPA